MINTPFTAEEKADLQFLDISELLDVNLVKNFIRLFPPEDVHDVLVNSLYLGIKFIDSKYPKKWLTKSRIENIAGLVHRAKPKNITEIGEESHMPKSKNGIYVKPNGWKSKSQYIPYRQYGIPPAHIDDNNNINNRYSENDKEIYPQWWPDYDETTEAERSAAIERDRSKHKHHHHITDMSNQKSKAIQTIERESIAVQANPTDLYNNKSKYSNRRSTSVPPNLSKSLKYNKQQQPALPSKQYNDNYYYDYNRDYYYRNQPPPPALPPPPPSSSNISPYYAPPPPPPPPSYYYPLQPQQPYDYYSQSPPPVNPYNDYPYYDQPPPPLPPNYHTPYNYNDKHITIEEPVDMIVNHPKASAKLLKRCATPYPGPRRKYDDNGDEIDIAL